MNAILKQHMLATAGVVAGLEKPVTFIQHSCVSELHIEGLIILLVNTVISDVEYTLKWLHLSLWKKTLLNMSSEALTSRQTLDARQRQARIRLRCHHVLITILHSGCYLSPSQFRSASKGPRCVIFVYSVPQILYSSR
jgi:hypothetical protein